VLTATITNNEQEQRRSDQERKGVRKNEARPANLHAELARLVLNMMMVKGVASSNSVVVTMMAVNRNCKPWAFRRHIILTLTLSLLSVHVRGISSKSAPFVFTTAATRVSTGLENLGNTCYINAQLQCAYHIPLVQRLICQQRYQEQVCVPVNDEDDPVAEDACEAPPPKEESIALQALRLVFQDMEQAAEKTGVVASTRVLCHSLGIPVMEQQDTQEFWKLLLPAMDLHPLTDLYTGVYEDYIVALDGSGRERRREETYLDLSLDIPLDPTKASVEGSLAQQFGTPELLTVAQGNAWRPEKGADKVDAHKGCQLMQAGLPSILQLHLKRFHFDWTTETTTKINHPLTFPKELDLSNLVKEKETAEKIPDASLYDLQSIIVHMGEFNSGHYYGT
jgi:ubiquitin carboxyl-terminal hydrolase 7